METPALGPIIAMYFGVIIVAAAGVPLCFLRHIMRPPNYYKDDGPEKH